jgi:predicted anti-sigma-YlaC factor YlaD
MDCSFVQHKLVAYRENKLQTGTMREIESHLSGCDSCKSLLDALDVVEKVINEARAAEPNPFATARIINFIKNNLDKKEEKKGFVLRPVLVTLAVLCALTLGYTIGKSGFNRISRTDDTKTRIETLKSDLYIHDFIEENNTLIINE